MSPSMRPVLLLGLLTLILVPNARASRLSAEQWREDLAALDEAVRGVHKFPFHTVSEDDYARRVRELDTRIPELSDQEIIVEMAALVAAVNDGHTRLTGWYQNLDWGFHSYPLALYWFSDGLFVRQAHPDHAELAGAEVIRIGEFTPEEALAKIGRVVPADNVHGRRGDSHFFLILPEVLWATGILDPGDSEPFEFEKNGRRWSPRLEAMDQPWPGWTRGFVSGEDWVDMNDRATAPTPLWRRHPERTYWFEYLPEEKILYVQQNQIRNDPAENLESFYGRVGEELESRDVTKLVLDLRLNGGGNNYLNRPPFTTMVRADAELQTFTVLGRQTFSACQNLVNELSRWTDTVFVGEPTAERVNFYGDTRPTELPHSGLVVRASWLWWQNMDPRDERDALYPDLSVELSSEDYASNRDPVLDAIRGFEGLVTRQSLLELVRAGEVDTACERIRAAVQDPRYRYWEAEDDINRLGYQLLEAKRLDEALAIFQTSAETFPDSWNAWDSLAETYEVRGDLERALELFRKSLSLNPESPTGLAAVERIEASLGAASARRD